MNGGLPKEGRAALRRIARRLRPLGVWILLSLPLHLLWEVSQLPLYTLWPEAGTWYMAWAVIHCTAGDGLIAAVTYLAAAALAGGLDWPWRAARRGLPAVLAAGVAYTAFSEWRNVYQLGAWAYAEVMPTIAGIGVSPLLQWVITPTIAWALLSSLGRPR